MKLKNDGHRKEAGAITGQGHDKLPLDAVEGTNQCARCQRFMRLGDGQLCFTVTEKEIRVAEVVGWSPGSCAHFIKLADPFLVARTR